MSNHLGQIYSTTKNAEKYIVLNSQNVELSGNVKLTNGNLDISQNLIFNNFSVSDKINFRENSGSTSYNIINNSLTVNNDASLNNVDIDGNLNVGQNLTLNNSYGNTDDILISRGANNAPLWSSNYAKTDTTYTAGNNMVLNGTAFSVATSPAFAAVIGEGFFGLRGNSGYIDYNPNHGCNFVVNDNNGNTGNLRFYANLTYHSDDRIKHNEIDVSNGLIVIRQLKPQRYIKTPKITTDKTEISNTGTIEVGFIAQEVKQINDLSFAVDGGNGTTIDPYGNETEDLYALNYNAVFAYNIAATKELDNIVTSQKEEIILLKNALNVLLSEAGKPTI